MDKGTDKNNLNWLSPDALIEFIDELREADYKIGISQYIAAHDLILVLIAQGEALDSPERLRNLLGPIFCSSPIEQEEFQQRFNRWVELYSRLNLLTGEVNLEAKAFADELATERALSYRMQSGLIFLSTFIVLSIILFPQHTDKTASIKQTGLSPTPTGLSPTPTPTELSPTPTPTELSPKIIYINPSTETSPNSPSTETSPNLPFDWQILVLLLTVYLVIFIIWRLWWLWRANLFLQRHSTTQQPELQKISISGLEEKLVPSITLLEIARSLKYRIRIPSNELDVDKTINATLRQGGWLTPVYRNYQVLPEYLFLVNRVSYRDHQAKFVEEIIARLKNEGVFITVYFFDDDPRICFPSDESSPVRLREITSKYSQHCLVIISDTDNFFSSINGELEPWVNQLTNWENRAVLTPTPAENWGYKELELAQKFIILPATIKGLLVLSQRLRQGFATYFLAEEQRIPLPDSLHVRPYIWIERNPPPTEQINAMLDSLEKYLGKDSFYWLSACAIFPQLDWQITIYLGNVLKTESGALLIEVCSLTDLARLPWLRYGYMPDWLRVYLIATLTQEQQQVIRSVLQDLLITSVQGSVSKLQLEIARQYPNLLPKLANSILKILSKKAAFDSPLRDYIFLGFMREKSILSLKVSDEFSRLVQKQKKNYWWMKALRKLGIMIKPQIHQPSFAASANTSSSLISRRQFLKWLGLGGVAMLTSVVAHQVTKNRNLRLIKLNNDLASRIIEYMVAKNYQVFTGPKEYNIVYVEGMNENGSLNKNTPNQFNDRRIVIEVINGVPKIVGNWEATTEPGNHYTDNPMNPGGAAHIKFGQYKAWAVGYHGNADRHEALIQVDPITVYRDSNKDFQRTGEKQDTGLFQINQHWGYDAPSNDIKNASAGELVGRTREGHREFMALIKQDRRYVANKDYVFYTTIIPGDDLVKIREFDGAKKWQEVVRVNLLGKYQ